MQTELQKEQARYQQDGANGNLRLGHEIAEIF